MYQVSEELRNSEETLLSTLHMLQCNASGCSHHQASTTTEGGKTRDPRYLPMYGGLKWAGFSECLVCMSAELALHT
jgi:hypothetical protein